MIEVLLFFIGASLLLYVLFGGADYGAGILEIMPLQKKLKIEEQHLIQKAMGPVWEANHMWLILVVVILFMGFPFLFTTLMTSLHFPMLALLVGIIIRGCAFTFRHYDAIYDEKSQKFYSLAFSYSSLWASYWLGVIAASLNRGYINPNSLDFFEAYIRPWWGLFPSAMGLFVIFIFAFLASIYLIGETDSEPLRKVFTQRALFFNIAVIICGGFLFALALVDNNPLPYLFFNHPLAILCMTLATLCFILLWILIQKRKPVWVRITAGAQMSLILLGWLAIYFPKAVITTDGYMSFYETAAPHATMKQLTIALVVGSAFIFPSLIYLLKVFKSNPK